MIKKMVSLNLKEVKAHEEAWGSFSDFPPGWIEVTHNKSRSEKVRNSILEDLFSLIEYRQMLSKERDRDPVIIARLYYRDSNGGVAIGKDYQNGSTLFRYFEFGCQHSKFTSTNQGRCLTKHTCKDCGYEWHIDSSD